jgi:raffinose/stachyose/melibiose transport system substrate-binding protein
MKAGKRWTSGTVVSVILAALAIGLGAAPQAGAGTVELKFLHKWPEPERIPYFQGVVKEFESVNPGIKINMEAVADEPMKDKLRVMMGGSVPDIFFSWSGEFAKKFVRAGAAMDLTP